MTKNEKTLNWRLSDLPTAGEVAELVDSEVITKEEAREILFTQASSSDEKVKALEEQVAFLQGLVETLAKNRSASPWNYNYVATTPAVYWTKTNKTLVNSGLVSTTGYATGSSSLTMSVSDNSVVS